MYKNVIGPPPYCCHAIQKGLTQYFYDNCRSVGRHLTIVTKSQILACKRVSICDSETGCDNCLGPTLRQLS